MKKTAYLKTSIQASWDEKYLTQEGCFFLM